MKTPTPLALLALLTGCADTALPGTWWGAQTCTAADTEQSADLTLTIAEPDDAGLLAVTAAFATVGTVTDSSGTALAYAQEVSWDGEISRSPLGALTFGPDTVSVPQEDSALTLSGIHGQHTGDGVVIDLTITAQDAAVDCSLDLTPAD